MAEKIVMTKSNEATMALFGSFDINAHTIEKAFDVKISNKNIDVNSGDAITVVGERENVDRAVSTLEYLKRMIGDGESISRESVEYVIGIIRDGVYTEGEHHTGNVICVTNRGKPIKAKTIGQKNYIEAIKNNTVCTLCSRCLFVANNGRISNIAAPVVPIKLANIHPIAKNKVFTHGLACISPARCIPPVITYNANNNMINGK